MSHKLISLEISSYCGISIGATHHYGHLLVFRPHEKIELRKALTAAECKKLNKGKTEGYGLYKVGDETGRFDSEKELIETAEKVWKDHFPNGMIMVQNRGCSVDPCKMLIGPKEIKDECNILFDECVRIGWWDLNEDKMQDLCDRWDALVASVITKE